MKPAPFSYHKPSTVEDAVRLLAELDNAKIIAGGQSMIPMINMRFIAPDHVVDLNAIPDIESIVRDRGLVKLGAMVRQADVLRSEMINAHLPLLRDAVEYVGHPQTRSRGTVGGSLCHLDPAAEIPLVALVLDAQLHLLGPSGARLVKMADWPLGYMTPNIGTDEILLSIDFPEPAARSTYAFVEHARRRADFAIVSVAAYLEHDAFDKISRCSIGIGGLSFTPVRIHAAEARLVGHVLTPDLVDRASEVVADADAASDAYYSSEYRKHVAQVLMRRALKKAASRLSKGER
jgi:carbon-monoxide dehydrogenase medium subunit